MLLKKIWTHHCQSSNLSYWSHSTTTVDHETFLTILPFEIPTTFSLSWHRFVIATVCLSYISISSRCFHFSKKKSLHFESLHTILIPTFLPMKHPIKILFNNSNPYFLYLSWMVKNLVLFTPLETICQLCLDISMSIAYSIYRFTTVLPFAIFNFDHYFNATTVNLDSFPRLSIAISILYYCLHWRQHYQHWLFPCCWSTFRKSFKTQII